MEAKHRADLKTEHAGDRRMWRQAAGYGFVGVGAPSLLAGSLLIHLVFVPSKHGYVMAEFRWNHPAFIAGALLLVAGLGLFISGLGLIWSPNRQAKAEDS